MILEMRCVKQNQSSVKGLDHGKGVKPWTADTHGVSDSHFLNKGFLGGQPRQGIYKIQRFGDHLHHQGSDI